MVIDLGNTRVITLLRPFVKLFNDPNYSPANATVELEKRFPLVCSALVLILGESKKYLALLFNSFDLHKLEVEKLDKGLQA